VHGRRHERRPAAVDAAGERGVDLVLAVARDLYFSTSAREASAAAFCAGLW
jgi:hypothetical protein